MGGVPIGVRLMRLLRALLHDNALFVVPGLFIIPRTSEQRDKSSTMDSPMNRRIQPGAHRAQACVPFPLLCLISSNYVVHQTRVLMERILHANIVYSVTSLAMRYVYSGNISRNIPRVRG